MTLNREGTRLATSSEKVNYDRFDVSLFCFVLSLSLSLSHSTYYACQGTLIRVFDTQNSQLLQELRRGADRAEIYSLSFNNSSRYVCVSSDKGTLHIFQLQEGVG